MRSQIKHARCQYFIGHTCLEPQMLRTRLDGIARGLLPAALAIEFQRRNVNPRKIQLLRKTRVRFRLRRTTQLSDLEIAEIWAKSVADQVIRQLEKSDPSVAKVFESEAAYLAGVLIASQDPDKQQSDRWWCAIGKSTRHGIDRASDLLGLLRENRRMLPSTLIELRKTGQLEHVLAHLGRTNGDVIWRDLVFAQNEAASMPSDMDRWRPLFDAAMLTLDHFSTDLPTDIESRTRLLEKYFVAAGPLPRWGDRHAMSEAVFDIIIWLCNAGYVTTWTNKERRDETIPLSQSIARQRNSGDSVERLGRNAKTTQNLSSRSTEPNDEYSSIRSSSNARNLDRSFDETPASKDSGEGVGRLGRNAETTQIASSPSIEPDDECSSIRSRLDWLNIDWLIDQMQMLKRDARTLAKEQSRENIARRLAIHLGFLPSTKLGSASGAGDLLRLSAAKKGNPSLIALDLLAAVGQQAPHLTRDPFTLRLVASIAWLADAQNFQPNSQRAGFLAQLKSGQFEELDRWLPETHVRELNRLGDFISTHGALLSEILDPKAHTDETYEHKTDTVALESQSAGVVLLLRAVHEAGLHGALLQAAKACPRLPTNITLWLPLILLRWAGQAQSEKAPLDPMLLRLAGVGEPMLVKDLKEQLGGVRWSDLNSWLVKAHTMMALQGRWPAGQLKWTEHSTDSGQANLALHPESGCMPLAIWRSDHRSTSRPRRWSHESEAIFGRRTTFRRADAALGDRIEQSFAAIADGKIGYAKVDFAIGVLSINLLLHWARWLRGLSSSSPAFLLEKLIRRAGCLRQTSDGFEVQLDPCPYDLVLKHTGYLEPLNNLPWLHGKRIMIRVDRSQ